MQKRKDQFNYIEISNLPKHEKEILWDAIKAKNPAKADAIRGASKIAKMFPGSEVVMTKSEVLEYIPESQPGEDRFSWELTDTEL